jgi:hypothetical protein
MLFINKKRKRIYLFKIEEEEEEEVLLAYFI